MATATLYDVTTFDETTANTKKTETDLKEYQELCYNNRDDEGILELITQYNAKVDEIIDDVTTIGKVYGDIEGAYDKYDTDDSSFETRMKSYQKSLETVSQSFQNRSKDLTQAAYDKIYDMSQEDKTLLDDVEILSDMLGLDYDDASMPSATFIS